MKQIRPVKHRHKSRPVIYKITSPSGKAYVGQTKWFAQRMARHKNDHVSGCRALCSAIQKYGWDAMQVEVIWEGAEGEMDAMEKLLIEQHATRVPCGYNLVEGGGANPAKNPEVQAKLKAMRDSGEMRKRQQAGWARRREGKSVPREPRSRYDPRASRGPKSKEAKARQRATWERKREAKWQAEGLSDAQKETKRHNYAMRVANEMRHKLGIPLDDKSFGPRHKTKYWEGKHRERL